MPRPRSFGGHPTSLSAEKSSRPATAMSPLSGVSSPAIAAQRRRLAAARRAEQREELALLDLEADVVHREHAPGPIAAVRVERLDEIADAEHGQPSLTPIRAPSL